MSPSRSNFDCTKPTDTIPTLDCVPKLCLDIVIVGGGLCGLALAYNLQSGGHTVLVLERKEKVGMMPTGVHCPPNMTKLLMQWGLGLELEEFGRVSQGNEYHEGATGELIGELPYDPTIMQQFPGEYMFLRHSDLHEALYRTACKAGVRIRFNSSVIAIDPHTPSVTLEGGEIITAKLVIGADGHQGLVQRYFCTSEAVETHHPTQMSYMSSISLADIAHDDELSELCTINTHKIWLNDTCSVTTHPIGGRTNPGLSVCVHWSGQWQNPLSVSGSAPPPHDYVNFETFEPRIWRLMSLVQHGVLYKYTGNREVHRWVHDSKKVLVIGDAAHTKVPNSSQGTAMCMEDVATLGALFSWIQAEEEVGMILHAYDILRKPRVELTSELDVDQLNFITLPLGLQTHGRLELSEFTRRRLEGIPYSEHELWEQWVRFQLYFEFNAYDDVDTWWVELGSVLCHRVMDTRRASMAPIIVKVLTVIS